MTIEEYKPSLDIEKKLELRDATRSEIQLTSGVTESTNRVEVKSNNNTGGLVLEKHIGRKDGQKVARTEVDILKHLANQESVTVFSRLASDRVYEDEDGNPTIYIDMNPDYLPFAGDSTFFQEILDEDNPRKLTKAVSSIHEMHKFGVYHGDLHLNNIGELPPEAAGTESRSMIIDFDLGRRDDYLYPDEMEDDLARFTTHVLINFGTEEQDKVKQKLFNAINNKYGESIYMQRFEEKIGKTLSQDESYLA